MATINPFDLLDGDFSDPSEFLAAAEQKAADKPKKTVNAAPAAAPAKLPGKPLPPSQAVREAKSDGGARGGRGGAPRGIGRGRGGIRRDLNTNEVNHSTSNENGGFKSSEDGEAKNSERRVAGDRPRGAGAFRGGRRVGFANGDTTDGERPKRAFERRSGTGRGNEVKREGSGRGNWGTSTDGIPTETEEPVTEVEKEAPLVEEAVTEATKVTEEEKEIEPEDKEMTLEEYEKVLEEKRKALLSLKTEERKVDIDKELKSMQALSSKKTNGEIFIKLGSEKDKKKDIEKDEKAKKSVSINEFLKPADGERYNGYRGRGRGRGARGGFGGSHHDVAAPKIEDPGQFPSLGGK